MPSSHSQAKLPSSSVTSLNAAPGGPSSKLPPRVRRWSTYALGLLTPLLPGFIVAVHYLSPMTQFFRRRPLSSWPYTFPDPYYECRADEAESCRRCHSVCFNRDFEYAVLKAQLEGERGVIVVPEEPGTKSEKAGPSS
ncbi:hypothetical protein S40285_09991 [Stachybotrys chlorohalonatus IBT 40285]|uniref:Transmembrane protein n=1 Tax=Stachybotrys chlorohalonatus (strain IBT 40285) TaxID=1283841 RepID=A0A084R0V6_STAC4|nr:hypothetical protein S40285_09991 [Stachybotrys chlorohalonata IBT 40285]